MEPTELHTARLLLRPYRADDVDDVFAYASDEEFSRYTANVPHPYTHRNAEDFIADALTLDWDVHPKLAMELNGHIVGDLSLHMPDRRRIAELGYGIARPYWGLGLTTEACRAVVDWGFGSFNITKVFCNADARNAPSIRIMEKLGMQREAYLRQHRTSRGEQVDQVMYAVLRDEWQSPRLDDAIN